MLRVRFAPSPTGYLHIGSARTFIFNWLYARHCRGTMILRIDDTDIGRNTEESLRSIYDGLRWLELDWDEEHRQSERIRLHVELAHALLEKGAAYRDFTPADLEMQEKTQAAGAWLFNSGMREMPASEGARRAAAGEPFVIRFRVPRGAGRMICFNDAVYGEQQKAAEEVEDFALLRSDGSPTYHLASCTDDIDLRITDIIRGQDHITNTFKHVLIFEAAGAPLPVFAHLPLLIAPDGAKLSKRKHGLVVSVTTYRDAGFLPHAYVNFLCLLGWSPKDDREQMTRQELIEAFSLEGINRANAMVNFTEEDPIDPKALWLNGAHLRAITAEELADRSLPFLHAAALRAERHRMIAVAPLIQERIRTLRDVVSAADFFFAGELAPYDPTELIPDKGDRNTARAVLERARDVLARTAFEHQALETALRAAAGNMKLKAGQMFQPIRVAVCGRKVAPPLFGTLEVLGRETCLHRIDQAIRKLA